MANGALSNKFWQAINITSKDKQHVLKYRTYTIYTAKHAQRFNQQHGPAHCPLCGAPDSSNHLLLRCNHETPKKMHTNRHHLAVSLCGAEISKGEMGSSIVTMDAHNNDKLSNLNIHPPRNITRTIPDWVFPNQQHSPARHQSRPDGVLISSISQGNNFTDPKQIPYRDRDLHLIEFKFCSDTNPHPTLQKARQQHQSLISKLQSRSLRGQHRNNKVTLHVILVGVAGTIYNHHTITPLLRLGLSKYAAHKLATKLHLHAVKSLTHITRTRHALQYNTQFDGAPGGRGNGRDRPGYVRARRRSGRMADNPPDPH